MLEEKAKELAESLLITRTFMESSNAERCLECVSEAIQALAALDECQTCDWIPVSERLPKENIDYTILVWSNEGDQCFVYECDCINGKFYTMTGDVVNFVTHWQPIVLPKPDCQPKPAEGEWDEQPSGEFVVKLRKMRLCFTNNVGEKPYYRCEDEKMNIYVADDQLFCTIHSADFQGDYDEEIAIAFCEIGEVLQKAAARIKEFEERDARGSA